MRGERNNHSITQEELKTVKKRVLELENELAEGKDAIERGKSNSVMGRRIREDNENLTKELTAQRRATDHQRQLNALLSQEEARLRGNLHNANIRLERIPELRDEVSKLMDQLKSLQIDIGRREEIVRKLTREKEELRHFKAQCHALREVESQNQCLLLQMERSQTSLENAIIEKDSMMIKLTDQTLLRRQLQQLEITNRSLQAKVAHQDRRLEQVSKELQEANNHKSQIDTINRDQEASICDLQLHVERLKVKERNRDLAGALAALQRENVKLNSDCSELRAEKDDLLVKLVEFEGRSQSLQVDEQRASQELDRILVEEIAETRKLKMLWDARVAAIMD